MNDLEGKWGPTIKSAAGPLTWEAQCQVVSLENGIGKIRIELSAKLMGGSIHEIDSDAAFFHRRVEDIEKVLRANVPGSSFEGFETFDIKSVALEIIRPRDTYLQIDTKYDATGQFKGNRPVFGEDQVMKVLTEAGWKPKH